MRKIVVDNDEIVRLYVEDRVAGRAIGKHLGVSESVVFRVLEEAGVKRSARAHLPMDEVVRLYVQEHWPLYRIAEKFGVVGSTVARHLREVGVQTRNTVEAHQPTGRRPCPNSVVLRSYVLGLVWGDFWVKTHSPDGLTVSVSSSTTHLEQVQLIRDVFEPFGPVYEWGSGLDRGEGRSFRASLDLSFSFLFAKYQGAVPEWIRGVEAQAAFAAGYVDAEGCFGVYEGRARFKLDSYDCEVLEWLHRWSRSGGIRSRLRRVARAGDRRPDQGDFRKDLWRVNVNESLSLLRFIATLDPYLRHSGRRSDAERARQNIVNRLRGRIGDQLEPLPLTSGAHRPWQIDTG